VANVSQSFLNPYAQESQGIDRRRALAQALQQQSLQSSPTQVAPGGIAIRDPWSSIGRVAQAYFAKQGMQKADTEQAQLNQKRAADAQAWLQKSPMGSNPNAQWALEGAQQGMPGADTVLEQSLKAPTENSPYAKIDPKDYTPESFAAFQQSGAKDYSQLRPLPKEGTSPYAKVDPKDYTPESFAEFTKTQDHSKLRAVGKPESLSEVGRLMKERADAQARGDTAAVQQYDTVLASKVKSGEADKFKVISGLRDDYRTESKNFHTVHEAYQRLVQSAKNPSGAGDISLIFGYMRMLDPASTVREGEFATAQTAGSVPETIVGMYNRAVSGERLTPAVRQDFVTRAGMLYQPELQQQQQRDAFYAKNAQEFGIDPMLVFRPVKGVAGPKAEKPQTAGATQQPATPLSAAEQKELDDLRKRFKR
jgi:hypothetical protein